MKCDRCGIETEDLYMYEYDASNGQYCDACIIRCYIYR